MQPLLDWLAPIGCLDWLIRLMWLVRVARPAPPLLPPLRLLVGLLGPVWRSLAGEPGRLPPLLLLLLLLPLPLLLMLILLPVVAELELGARMELATCVCADGEHW